MKKISIIIIVILTIIGGAWAVNYHLKTSTEPNQTYETTKAFRTTIQKKGVATGKIVPQEEIDIKPNISGIISELRVEAGHYVSQGEVIAKLKVVPSISSLSQIQNQINNANINLDNQQKNYNRQNMLYRDGVISKADFDNAFAQYKNAQESLRTAKEQYQIAKTGTSSNFASAANTTIRATVSGVVLDVPVEKGFQVIESNSFNAGTTIATIADIKKMNFEGKVDESEIGGLKQNMNLNILVGAMPNEKLTANLYHIAPQGVENNGVIQFEIKAQLLLNDSLKIRAGYSANAEFITASKQNILALKEAELQYDPKGNPFVEVQKGEQWETRNLVLGISDGEKVEVVSGISEKDLIKIHNTDLETRKGNRKNKE